MKKLSFLLALCLGTLLGCRPPSYPISNSDASGAVYKIYAKVHLGADLLDPLSQASTELNWWGTAWVVDHAGPRSYLMTAGHVCETGATVDRTDLFGGKHSLPVESVEYTLESADGVLVQGARVLVDDDKVDLCVLAVQGDLGPAIPLADRDPKYSEEGWYLGAPHGVWGHGMAGIFRTVFMGRGRPFEGNCSADMPFCDRDEMTFSSAQAAPGASGSPIIFDGRAVAVLNMGPTNFMTIALGVPWEDMHSVLSRARHEEPRESY